MLVDLKPQVEYLLEEEVKVLIYSGDKDFICNWMGGEMWTNALKVKILITFLVEREVGF